ncbi:hypothetical protein EN45_046420 [Penicillium chrysogenum]|uniref:Integrase catalytic domain-containing protein n=1 Tax=Penicillium chrysogenum TaxID=5076 RepID=A0A167YRN6_PENCH|nr:hypothetical protein EN45_046420 [Penicillium chrysogenum]
MNREIGVQTVTLTNAPKGAFSTWQGHQEAKPEMKQEKLPFEKRRCPCGSSHPRHKVATCYIMNEAIRPEGYTLNERTLEKAKKKLAKDLAWKQWVDKVVAEAQLKAEYANQVSFATTYQKHEAVQIRAYLLTSPRTIWKFQLETAPQRCSPGEAPPQQAYATQAGVLNLVKPQESKASSELWHRRLAHVEPRTIAKLASMVDGVVLEDKKSTEQQSLCQIFKPECQLAIKEFVQLARNQWKLPIKAFHYDNEAAAGRAAEYSLTADGILVYHTPPGHSEMNGYAERSGGMIITRMRMLALEGKLPKDLWPEFASAAVWLLNLKQPQELTAEEIT